ncbi:MAG: 50S ribosomal protein L6 [Chlamydiales bacterium]|nr:50S ribosomal protein L6 [Chlamydiales bacterium]
MSRKARMPIILPKGVEATIEGIIVSIKGPNGVLSQKTMEGLVVQIENEQIMVSLDESRKEAKNFLGLYWSLIANMVKGVSEGYGKRLEMIGVGYRAAVQGQVLDLSIGVSHPVKLPIPDGIAVTVEKNTFIQLKGIDKQQLGQFAATIRSKRPPEPYKGKGIRYEGEYVRRKAGKSGKK